MMSPPTDNQNLSFVLEKVGSFRFEDRPIPTLGPRDVLVNIQYTGICGSDVHYWTHGSIGPYTVKEPLVLGHESSGIITAVGGNCKQAKVGDRVALEPGIPCRYCPRCKEGKYNLCYEMNFAATPPIDGTLAKYYALPEDFCYTLGKDTSLEEGALVEPLSIAIHICKQAGIRPGQSLVVFGAGPIGLLCCGVAKAFGASKIVAVDINEDRLAFAKKYAATHTFMSRKAPAEEVAKAIREECNLGRGADVVIDASGAEPCIQTSIHVVRTGGSYVQGGLGNSNITFPIGILCDKELTMKGSFRYGAGDYELAIAMLEDGTVSVKELITDCYPFEEAEKAFMGVKAVKGIKTLIKAPQ